MGMVIAPPLITMGPLEPTATSGTVAQVQLATTGGTNAAAVTVKLAAQLSAQLLSALHDVDCRSAYCTAAAGSGATNSSSNSGAAEARAR